MLSNEGHQLRGYNKRLWINIEYYVSSIKAKNESKIYGLFSTITIQLAPALIGHSHSCYCHQDICVSNRYMYILVDWRCTKCVILDTMPWVHEVYDIQI
jgi:hypothetical protein